MDNNITNPTLSPDQWLATPPIPQRRAPTLTLRGKFASRAPLPDIAPDRHGVMRWADEATWIPEPQPTWTTGLFGRPRRADWRNHALAAASQVCYLARRVAQLQHQIDAADAAALISGAQADAWAGRPLTNDEIDRLSNCIPQSSIPDAVNTIVSSWDD